MKKALIGIGPVQLGALRIVLTALILFGFAYKAIRQIERSQWKWLIVSGLIGSFFPAFFLALAQTEISSSVISVLNSLVPLQTVLLGFAVFRIASTKRQIAGVIVGFLGTSLLILKGAELNPSQNYVYVILVILSTLMYALNINIIKRYLNNVKPLYIVAGNYIGILFHALIILYWSDFFTKTTYENPDFKIALFYIGILTVFGTILLKILYYKLIQISTPVFAYQHQFSYRL